MRILGIIHIGDGILGIIHIGDGILGIIHIGVEVFTAQLGVVVSIAQVGAMGVVTELDYHIIEDIEVKLG
jgi:hypothetical protein